MIQIRLFAILRERAGAEVLEYSPEKPPRCCDVLDYVAEKYPATAELVAHCRVAVNGIFAGPDRRLSAGDEVAVLPPVSGG